MDPLLAFVLGYACGVLVIVIVIVSKVLDDDE